MQRRQSVPQWCEMRACGDEETTAEEANRTLLAIAAVEEALHDARLADALLAEKNDLEVHLGRCAHRVCANRVSVNHTTGAEKKGGKTKKAR